MYDGMTILTFLATAETVETPGVTKGEQDVKSEWDLKIICGFKTARTGQARGSRELKTRNAWKPGGPEAKPP